MFDAVLYLKRQIGNMPLWVFSKDYRNVFSMDELNLEIGMIALPAALALLADPIASLIDTAFIGHLGPVELAAVGVAIAIFNQVSKIAIFPLVSVTTSFVAEEDTTGSLCSDIQGIEIMENGSSLDDEKEHLVPKLENMKISLSSSDSPMNIVKVPRERKNIASASSALLIGGVLGLVQALFLIFSATPLLNYMGIKSDSPMLSPAQKYLTLRSIGAPAVLLSLAMQGVF